MLLRVVIIKKWLDFAINGQWYYSIHIDPVTKYG